MSERYSRNRLHYPNLKIRGFRGIKAVEIPKLGRATLITGKNNTGKTAVLEALRLHAANAAPEVVYDILKSHAGRRAENGADAGAFYDDGPFAFSPLFYGFPTLSRFSAPIVISTDGGERPTKLEMRMGRFVEKEMANGNLIKPLSDGAHGLEEREDAPPAMLAETRGRMLCRRLIKPAAAYVYDGYGFRDIERTPCALINPYGETSLYGHNIGGTKYSVKHDEKRVAEALRIIDPQITAVSASEIAMKPENVVVHAKNISRPVPLEVFGDGALRLFAIFLTLGRMGMGGILLIDEFEKGLHHKIQADVWKMIIGIARKLDVQVFATTHSWDAVKAFQKAASESPGEDSLVRLTHRYDRVFATGFSEESLEIVVMQNIEVRG